MKTKPLKIIFVGGGSGGSVSPLLAVAEELRKQQIHYKGLFVGSTSGPEAGMVKGTGLEFTSISSGKLRRYFSIKNLLTPFQVLIGFFQSLKLTKDFRPNVAFGTGSFIQVPVLYAAKLFGAKVLIHQQDARASLANTLCAPIASKITVSLEASLKSFFQGSGLLAAKNEQKVVFTGNPFREKLALADKADAQKFFSLSPEWPTLLVLGGGTGAKFINSLIVNNIEALLQNVQIIHITGTGKMQNTNLPNYHAYEFTNRMDLAYAAADIVVSRAGLSTITELSNLGKVSIVIPMPDSHQEENAEILWEKKAAIVLDQRGYVKNKFVQIIKKLLFNYEIQKSLVKEIKKLMPETAAKKITEVILKLAEKN